ncbi:TIGR04255 family protein [Rugamonas sp. A1-17]|nr:TIGR04255 family protein [Rugamonas sp. A1-17]
MKTLTNAPVYYTVAQIQFNPILNLEGYVPAIQARMREACFPDFKREVFQQLAAPNGGIEQGQMAAPTVTPLSRYMFGDIEGRSLFLLDTNTLSFQTTAYDTFKTFSATLLKVLGILHDALHLDFVESIGIRYLDAVLPAKHGETLRDYLVPEVLGLSDRDTGALQHSISETATATQSGQLVSRVLIRHGAVGLPSDWAGAPAPAIASCFTHSKSLHAIIDTDASFNQREVFDLAKVEMRLSALHDEVALSFKAMVTAHAMTVWACAQVVEVAEPDLVRTPSENLARIREVLNPAVSDLAATLGVSRQSVYNWLNSEPVADENAAKLRDLAQAADVLVHEGVTINSALLKRKFANGRTLMQVAQAGESARDAALLLAQIYKREEGQRQRMKARFAHRAKTPATADFDLPMAGENG